MPGDEAKRSSAQEERTKGNCFKRTQRPRRNLRWGREAKCLQFQAYIRAVRGTQLGKRGRRVTISSVQFCTQRPRRDLRWGREDKRWLLFQAYTGSKGISAGEERAKGNYFVYTETKEGSQMGVTVFRRTCTQRVKGRG